MKDRLGGGYLSMFHTELNAVIFFFYLREDFVKMAIIQFRFRLQLISTKEKK